MTQGLSSLMGETEAYKAKGFGRITAKGNPATIYDEALDRKPLVLRLPVDTVNELKSVSNWQARLREGLASTLGFKLVTDKVQKVVEQKPVEEVKTLSTKVLGRYKLPTVDQQIKACSKNKGKFPTELHETKIFKFVMSHTEEELLGCFPMLNKEFVELSNLTQDYGLPSEYAEIMQIKLMVKELQDRRYSGRHIWSDYGTSRFNFNTLDGTRLLKLENIGGPITYVAYLAALEMGHDPECYQYDIMEVNPYYHWLDGGEW
jgi:hypothetical protein